MAKQCHDAAQASRRQLASHSGTDRPRSQDADLRGAKSALFAEVSFSLPKVSNDTYPSQVLFIKHSKPPQIASKQMDGERIHTWSEDRRTCGLFSIEVLEAREVDYVFGVKSLVTCSLETRSVTTAKKSR